MSLFVHALALFPAVATAILAVAALADRHEAIALNALRALDAAATDPPNTPATHHRAA